MLWDLAIAALSFGGGWWVKYYFGGLSGVEAAILAEYRKFGAVSVTSPTTGQQISAVPTAHNTVNS